MSNDPYGVKTSEATLDCNNRTVQIKTNDTPNSYMHITVKCDVKCSLAQQMTYKRLMENKGSEKYTLLDDYWARARRISATYARFCLEEEDGCDKQLQGRYYWMGLGAFASKTVACMLDTVQIKFMTLGMGIAFTEAYEGLAKGNFWLFQDIASWHFLYNMSVTKGEGYEGFVQCRDMKSVDVLCDTPKNIVKKKLPWASESLSKIGNLAKSEGRPQSGALERGMEKVHIIEDMILENKDKDFIRQEQFLHLIDIAKHEQGNILQPLIYEDADISTVDFQDWLPAMRTLQWFMPEVKLVLTSECEESQEKVTTIDEERKTKAYQEYLEAVKKEEDSIRHEIYKREGLIFNDKELNKKVLGKMEEEGIYSKIPYLNHDKASDKDIISKPQEGDSIVLEDYHTRMKWIKKAAILYHDLWGKNSDYMKSELATMASWLDQEDRFNWTITKKY